MKTTPGATSRPTFRLAISRHRSPRPSAFWAMPQSVSRRCTVQVEAGTPSRSAALDAIACGAAPTAGAASAWASGSVEVAVAPADPTGPSAPTSATTDETSMAASWRTGATAAGTRADRRPRHAAATSVTTLTTQLQPGQPHDDCDGLDQRGRRDAGACQSIAHGFGRRDRCRQRPSRGSHEQQRDPDQEQDQQDQRTDPLRQQAEPSHRPSSRRAVVVASTVRLPIPTSWRRSIDSVARAVTVTDRPSTVTVPVTPAAARTA